MKTVPVKLVTTETGACIWVSQLCCDLLRQQSQKTTFCMKVLLYKQLRKELVIK